MLNLDPPDMAANDAHMHPNQEPAARIGDAAPLPFAVPIRSLGPSQRERIARHLLALDEHDRYLRFGYLPRDEQIRQYVDGLDFERDEIYGIFNRRLELIAMAHLALGAGHGCASCAEFGVSVAKKARGRGYGSRLFERARMHARNEHVQLLFIHALSENTAMLHIARKAGATVEREGSESDAYLRLPPATFDSQLSEIVQDGFGETDYQLKAQARRFREMLERLQQLQRRPAGGGSNSSSER